MITRRISISLAVVFVCLSLVVSVNAQPNFADVYTGNIGARPLKFVPGRVLVKFKERVTDDEADQIVRGLGARMKRRALRRAFNVVSVPEEQIWGKVQALRHNPRVEYAHPDWIVYATSFPSDPPDDPRYATYQWNFHNSQGGIKMEPAWAINEGGDPRVVVAVLDTGIAYKDYPLDNPTYCRSDDFDDNTSFAAGYDFINNDENPNDDNGHGTHVASTIAEATDNGYQFAGIAFKTTLMPVKVLGKDGSGPISDIVDGIYYAADNGADIISMSFGTSAPRFYLTALENAVKYAHSNGVLLVAASGNAGANYPMYPARYSKVISVGATTRSGSFASYSNKANEICAPGGDYYDPVYQYGFTIDSDWYCLFNIQGAYGTSMATPHVSGVAALLLAEAPSLTNEEIRQILSDTADNIGVSACGAGFLNAHAALQAIASSDNPPMVEITAPAENEVLSGNNITIEIHASDDEDVEGELIVVCDVDGANIGITCYNSGGSYDCEGTWDTTTEGPHSISARATDSFGNVSTDSVNVFVDNVNEPPVASFTFECKGYTCDFDASGSYDPDPNGTSNGTIVGFAWDFGDGNIGSGVKPSHTYTTPRTYTVTLMVTDEGVPAEEGFIENEVSVSEEPTSLHIHALDATSRNVFWRIWEAVVSVTVYDDWQNPVSGATVYGLFSDGSTLFECTTNTNGKCSVFGYQWRLNCLTFTVTDVWHDTLEYDPSSDVDRAIEVCRP